MRLDQYEGNGMQLSLAQLKTFLALHWASMLAACYPVLIILDTYSLPSPERIYEGQPFFYSWYIDTFDRASLLIVVGILLFCGLIIRIFVVKSDRFRLMPPAAFFSLSLLVVLVWASTPAIGVDHIAGTSVYNQTKYNLFRQINSKSFKNEFVLVKCDSLGLLCQFAEKWEREVPFFDASNYGLRLDTSNKTLYVTIDGGGVSKYPLE
jgi:hypothetical protein